MAIPIRFVVLAMVVVATTVDYLTRVNINEAIIAMANPGNKSVESNRSDVCPYPASDDIDQNSTEETPMFESEKFNWNQNTQGVILGAFFYSYVLMQVPAGRSAEIFGGKWIILVGLTGSAVLNLLTPLVAPWVYLMIGSRVLLGFFQSGIFPAGFALLFKWLPKKERPMGFGLLDVGSAFGTVIAAGLTGYLSEHYGWPSAFYLSGAIGCVACLLFALIVTSEPAQSRLISKAELAQIIAGQPKDDDESDQPVQSPPVPWFAILTCPAVLAVIFEKFAISWTYLMLSSKLPLFLDNILHVSMTKNGVINGLIYAVSCITLTTCGSLSEYIIGKKLMSRTNTRKLFVTIGNLGSATSLFFVPLVGCDERAVIGLLMVALLSIGCMSGGDIPIPSELTNNFPATIYSLMNMVAMSSGFIAPQVVGLILDSGGEVIIMWRIVFWGSAALSLLGCLTFLAFGSAEIQSFDHVDDYSRKYSKSIEMGVYYPGICFNEKL